MAYVKLEDVLNIIRSENWNFAGLINHIEERCPTADVAELKNIKWRPYYYISKAEPPVGGKRQDGWSCSVCGKHSYSRKEICDGCNTVMWTVDVR